MEKNTGKVGEICQSKNVGTMDLFQVRKVSHVEMQQCEFTYSCIYSLNICLAYVFILFKTLISLVQVYLLDIVYTCSD